MGNSNRGSVQVIAVVLIAIIVLILIFWPGDKVNVELPSSTTSKDIIPGDILGYSRVETNALISKAPAAAVGATIVYSTADIREAYEGAKITDEFIQCYQKAGATDSSGFYMEENPILGGVIVVVDERQVSDLKLFLSCAIESGLLLSTTGGYGYQPCADKFTIETNFNNFHVLIAGTDTPVCKTIREYTLLNK